jgi:hypothetical protein
MQFGASTRVQLLCCHLNLQKLFHIFHMLSTHNHMLPLAYFALREYLLLALQHLQLSQYYLFIIYDRSNDRKS